jgi:hypothetical protein
MKVLKSKCRWSLNDCMTVAITNYKHLAGGMQHLEFHTFVQMDYFPMKTLYYTPITFSWIKQRKLYNLLNGSDISYLLFCCCFFSYDSSTYFHEIFYDKKELICELAYICLFSFRLYLMKVCIIFYKHYDFFNHGDIHYCSFDKKCAKHEDTIA